MHLNHKKRLTIVYRKVFELKDHNKYFEYEISQILIFLNSKTK